MPACLDEIGPATAAVAGGRSHSAIVRKITGQKQPAAPLSAREKGLMSIIDGTLSLRSLVDVSGMPETEALTILDRLARLELVTLE